MIAAYQRQLADVCLAERVGATDLAALGGDPERWLVYRRLVRARLREAIDHGFERLALIAGADRFGAWVDRFLATAPPRTPYLRDVPGEMLRFLEADMSRLPGAGGLPPWILDLARFEWAELDVAYAADEEPAVAVVDLAMDLPAAIVRSHRRLAVGYAVHAIGRGDASPHVETRAVRLLLYRDRSTHDVRTLELTPVADALIDEMARGDRPLRDLTADVAGRHGVALDGAFVGALGAFLADLTERGVLLGSIPRGGRDAHAAEEGVS